MQRQLSDIVSGDDESSSGQETEMINLSPVPSSSGYGSTSPVQEKTVDNDRQCFVPFCGTIFYIMAFMCLLCAMMMRESLSEAIVAMVNHTAVGDRETVAETMADINVENRTNPGYCPKQPEVEHPNGEFIWYSCEQGILLGSFYYGYVVTQVCSNENCTTEEIYRVAQLK